MMNSTSSFEDGGLFKKTTTPPQSPPLSTCDATEQYDSTSTSSSPGSNLRPTTPLQQQPPKILWSCIARDDVILAEANDVGSHDRNDVADAARQLLQQRCTPGFEYHTQNKRLQGLLFQNRLWHTKNQKNGGGDDQDRFVPLKGIKFHVFEHISDESIRNDLQLAAENDDDTVDDGNQKNENSNNNGMGAAAEQKESTPHLRVWVFAAIFDPNGTDRHDVQSFLEKLVHITDSLRTYDPEWKIARTLGLQASFAPTLQQRMEEVTYLGKVALLQQQVHACQEQMETNIDLMLENGDRAEDLNEQATHLQDMCRVFKKKAKEVKRQHMLANAKYGLVAGTAATGLAAIVIVPLVVAL
jgi:Synaptobrevin